METHGMLRSDADRRATLRQRCRGQIRGFELSSGLPFAGELLDVSRGGVRAAVSRNLASDQVVRLLFPCKGAKKGLERMIIGHVVHSKAHAGRHVVRIAFGWDAAVHHDSRTFRQDPSSRSLLRPFSRKLKSWVLSALNRQ
jgi:hypothetical protein